MRHAGLALLLIAASALPVLAQKNPPQGAAPAVPAAPSAPATSAGGELVATGIAATCLRFVTGDAGAIEAARAEGWTVDEYPAPDSFLASLSASRNIAGIGDANLFGSFETYPNFTLRFCRVDITTNADAGTVGIDTLSGWDGFDGTVKTTANGTFGAWEKIVDDPERVLLMTMQQTSGVMLQVSAITAEEGN